MENYKSKKYTIYVATHKKFKRFCNENMYEIIQNGCASNPQLGYLRDDEGENISQKKEMYNELTSLYWIWKNDVSDYVGLCHYRRYFLKNEYSKKNKNVLNVKFLYKTFEREKYDIILPFPYVHKGISNRESYINNNFESDLFALRECVLEKFPDYINSFDEVWNREYACMWNMFVCKKELLNEYCNWLFSILKRFESKIDTTGYNDSQIRLCGYMGERLLNVWVHQNKLKVKFVDICQTDRKDGSELKRNVKRVMSWIPIIGNQFHNEFYNKTKL